jgi:hypothetical protein
VTLSPMPISEPAPGSCGAVNSYDKSSLTKEKEVAMQKEIQDCQRDFGMHSTRRANNPSSQLNKAVNGR